MTNIKIEKGIPLPPDVTDKQRGPRVIFREMEEGDSVFIADGEKARSFQSSVYGTCPGFKIAIRKLEGGWRLWKIRAEKSGKPSE